MPLAWQVAVQLIHISVLRTAPPHTSQEQLLLFQLLITDGEGFQSDPRPSPPFLRVSLYLWLTVSVSLHLSVFFYLCLDYFCLLPPPSASIPLLLRLTPLPLPAPNSTVQFKSITPKPLTECGIHGSRY